MTSPFRPTLTPEQYREQSRLFRVEVANIMWSLVAGPALVGSPRKWRALTPAESEEVFDQLLGAVNRHASKDRVRLAEALP